MAKSLNDLLQIQGVIGAEADLNQILEGLSEPRYRVVEPLRYRAIA